jgi:hypothetical protein
MLAAFPSWAAKQTRESLAEWGRLLSDLDPEAMVAAVDALAQDEHRQFAPTLGEIRKSALAGMRRRAAEAASKRHEEWVQEQTRLATENARQALSRAGVDQSASKRPEVSDLVKVLEK